MTDPNLSPPANPGTPTQTASPASRWPLWAVGVVALLLMAVISWLMPSYRKVVHDSEQKDIQIQDLKKQIQTAQHTRTVTRSFYPNGRIASESSTVNDSSSVESDNSTIKTETDSRNHSESITKRGLFTGMIYADIDRELAFSGTYQFLGPISVGGCFAGSKAYLGIGLSF